MFLFNGSTQKFRAATVPAALTAVTVLCAVLAGVGPRSAKAFPAYSKKENKPCSYCHVNAAGGGKRNAAGLWYKAHGLSLVGYSPTGAAAPTAAAKKPTKPAAPKKPAKKGGSPPKKG